MTFQYFAQNSETSLEGARTLVQKSIFDVCRFTYTYKSTSLEFEVY